MSNGQAQGTQCLHRLGPLIWVQPTKAQVHSPLSLDHSNHTFLSTSGDGDGGTGDERLRRGPSKLVQTVGAPRRAAASSCSLRRRTRPTAAAWCRCGACCCSLHGSMESFVGRHHPRRRRRGAPIACEPWGGFEPGASGRRGCGESWLRRHYAKCEVHGARRSAVEENQRFQSRVLGWREYGRRGAHERWGACAWLPEARHGG